MMTSREEIGNFIEERLNTLGLLEGMFEVERNTGLEVGKTLWVLPSYEELEPFQVVSNIEFQEKERRYDVYTKVYALQELFYRISPQHVKKVYSLMERIIEESKTLPEEVQIGKEFITFLNRELVHACYDIWRQNYSRLFGIFPKDLPPLPFFPPHFRIFWKVMQNSFPMYFDLSKDVILGIWLRSLLKGLDCASWKWGVRILIERMFRNCKVREFDLEFKFSNAVRPLHPEGLTMLGRSRLGEACIGINALHSCGEIAIAVITPSLPMYLDLYPNGDARNFLSEVTEMWLNANLGGVASNYVRITWKFHFTGVKVPACLSEERRLHEGIFRLGHSFWLTG